MPNDIENAIKIFEKLKEVFKYRYDYHKHMNSLNAGAILLIIAILEGVFKEPKGIGIILSSIVCFVLSLMCSLFIMSAITNLILKMTQIHSALLRDDSDKIEKCIKTITSISDRNAIAENLQAIFFSLGIALVVFFAFVNFL